MSELDEHSDEYSNEDHEDEYSDEGEEDEHSDEDVEFVNPREKPMTSLWNQIERIRSTSSIATFGLISDFVDPGVSVNSNSPIRLPLSSDDAQGLIYESCPAPFGKGDKTIIDDSVRRTWQIEADKLQFYNQRWQACLDQIVHKVAKDLGVAGGSKNVQAILYKMFVYEKGGMFKVHKDTEKAPGMFGTLAICLPSPHTGGDVCVKHQEVVKSFKTSEHSASNASFVAWYADVDHEVEPVQSGYRWVPTYNLVNTAVGSEPSATFLQSRVDDFKLTLDQWLHSAEKPLVLIYPLAHKYTNNSLKLMSLKGEDFERASHIAQSCAQHGKFEVLLANMELRLDGNEDPISKSRTQPCLKQIVDLTGLDLTVHKGLAIGRWSILGGDCYHDRKPDKEIGGYLGNERGVANQFYYDSVVVIVPTQYFGYFMLGRDPQHNAYSVLTTKLRERAQIDESGSKILLLQICNSALARAYKSVQEKDAVMGAVATTAALSDSILFATAVEKSSYSFDPSSYVTLGSMINIRDSAVKDEDVAEALIKNFELHETVSNINGFRRGFSQKNPSRNDTIEAKFTHMWLDSFVLVSLKEIESASDKDARSLADIVLGPENSTNLKTT